MRNPASTGTVPGAAENLIELHQDMPSWRSGDRIVRQHVIYSCVVQGKPHFIHAPELPHADPEFFRALTDYAAARDVAVMADRRSRQGDTAHSRRAVWLPALVFTFSMEVGAARAETDRESTEPVQSASLQLVVEPERDVGRIAAVPNGASLDNSIAGAAVTPEGRELEAILVRHFDRTPDDPEGMAAELTQLAVYFSRYAEAAKLVRSLVEGNWRLRYRPQTFVTVVKGRSLSVESATVYFDPRSAAQFKFHDACATKLPFCVLSPADALLHELLHAQSVLLHADEFLAMGGMSGLMYPFLHERRTIERENILYQSMTAVDNKPRPIRSEHVGRHVAVACVTCIR
jgi:hypothetical protein